MICTLCSTKDARLAQTVALVEAVETRVEWMSEVLKAVKARALVVTIGV